MLERVRFQSLDRWQTVFVKLARKTKRDGAVPLTGRRASRLRLCPVVMISVALTLGAMPPVIASGASSETKNANLTWGGIVSETMLVVSVFATGTPIIAPLVA